MQAHRFSSQRCSTLQFAQLGIGMELLLCNLGGKHCWGTISMQEASAGGPEGGLPIKTPEAVSSVLLLLQALVLLRVLLGKLGKAGCVAWQ